MTVRSANAIAYKGKVYIPTELEIEKGVYLSVEPVRVVELSLDDLTRALEDAIKMETLQRRPVGKYDPKQDVILRATGAKSWNRLARNGASYGLFWREDRVDLYMSRLDAKGRFEDDPTKFQSWPTDVAMDIIAQAILADIATRTAVM